MIKVMLSLDLKNENGNRADLYKYLEEADWKKVKNVDTVWLKDFDDYTTINEQVLNSIKGEIAKPLVTAYKELKLDKIYYVAQIGNTIVVSRVIETRKGDYGVYPQELF
ncbi:hypothetical protein [Pseudomonas syringae]|uniref:hypothetical protein n=1 Tax=Pseudomonas syringae TaxID=317 RepID=UPI000EFBB5B0|nr:hypothetical protein [Pseudomonas syringae]QVI77582.1 hypothetical protein KHW13_11110 [Pseudomonas syringae]